MQVRESQEPTAEIPVPQDSSGPFFNLNVKVRYMIVEKDYKAAAVHHNQAKFSKCVWKVS